MAKLSLDHCWVFAPEFFDVMARRKSRWRTELEASSNGPYRILQRDKVFAVMNDLEPDDGIPEAEFTEEQSALLMAATLGADRRPTTLVLAQGCDETGKIPVLERTSEDAKVVGRMRYSHQDSQAFHVAARPYGGYTLLTGSVCTTRPPGEQRWPRRRQKPSRQR